MLWSWASKEKIVNSVLRDRRFIKADVRVLSNSGSEITAQVRVAYNPEYSDSSFAQFYHMPGGQADYAEAVVTFTDWRIDPNETLGMGNATYDRSTALYGQRGCEYSVDPAPDTSSYMSESWNGPTYQVKQGICYALARNMMAVGYLPGDSFPGAGEDWES